MSRRSRRRRDAGGRCLADRWSSVDNFDGYTHGGGTTLALALRRRDGPQRCPHRRLRQEEKVTPFPANAGLGFAGNAPRLSTGACCIGEVIWVQEPIDLYRQSRP